MSKDKREPDYPAELESQFILRLPEEPAAELRELLRNGDQMKNRLSIQIDQDMRKGEVKLDQRTMHAKIVDLPTVVESMKTIDNKSFYKTADICQMMICKEEPEPLPLEEESPAKNKKKDPYKVDKKFLFPHGITPPTKNVRKRRFRKTLKKKCAEAPEIEKEVKRLLRADNEAESITYEIINEDDEQIHHPKLEHKPEPSTSKGGKKTNRKTKARRNSKHEANSTSKKPASSNVVDIFGGAVSDSDLEDEGSHAHNEDARTGYELQLSESGPMMPIEDIPKSASLDFDPQMFELSHELQSKAYASEQYDNPGMSEVRRYGSSYDDDGDQSRDSKDSMTVRIETVRAELEELKERRKRTQHEITGMENLALRQRFQETLHTLNQEVMFKQMEYQGLLTLQSSEDI